ncbi:hypothetical protein Scep_016955 [Stephania cephalantha]|uniref:Uncharacterized protein n=1 Tax=Stephania cephalantha TaxID=152367 RepID=A0AAP0IQK2_9MAGN
MALRPEYESVRAALLHHDPLHFLDAMVKEILFEETRLELVKPLPPLQKLLLHLLRYARNLVPHFVGIAKVRFMHFSNYPIIERRYFHERGHIVSNCPTRPPRPKGAAKFASKMNSSIVDVVTDGSSSFPTIPLSEIEAIIKQVISHKATALSVTPSKSWFLNSECCNHITS